jgi:hypothetical protein
METKERVKTPEGNGAIKPSHSNPSLQGTQKQGFMHRLLEWIARGTEKSRIGPGACPS